MLEPAASSDREAVNALAKQVHDLHVIWQPEIYEHTDCLYDEKRFHEALEAESLYVAKLGSEIVGYALLPIMEYHVPGLVKHKVMKLEEICVAEGHRHSGIGRQMMEDIKVLAKQLGCTDIRLTCAPQNAAAVHLYESFGMEVKNIQYRLKI